MLIKKLSSKLLKYMVQEFHNTGKDCFDFKTISNEFNDIDISTLKMAIRTLSEDRFIFTKYYDNLPAIIYLKPASIKCVEDDTLIKKGYDLIKEIKSLL